MSLTPEEKSALAAQLLMLLEHNEPESILATLRRVAERKAADQLQTEREQSRWAALATACQRVEQELNANQPRQAAPETASTGN